MYSLRRSLPPWWLRRHLEGAPTPASRPPLPHASRPGVFPQMITVLAPHSEICPDSINRVTQGGPDSSLARCLDPVFTALPSGQNRSVPDPVAVADLHPSSGREPCSAVLCPLRHGRSPLRGPRAPRSRGNPGRSQTRRGQDPRGHVWDGPSTNQVTSDARVPV